MSMTIGRLAKKYGLSRSTLLYYDTIGLLRPATHEKGEYRRYGAAEQRRLEKILSYRQAGLALKDIGRLLDSPEDDYTAILEKRFIDLGREITELQHQQRIIAELLQNPRLLEQSAPMNKELWVSLLRQAGFDETAMRNWHARFERSDPQNHRTFLRHLQIPVEEIEQICRWATAGDPDKPLPVF